MPGFNGENRLSIEVVWEDVDLIEIHARLKTEDWCGETQAYTTSQMLSDFAEKLQAFACDSREAISFEDGPVGAEPAIKIRLAESDLSGHIVCQVELRKVFFIENLPSRAVVFAAMKTEPTFVDRFGRELSHLAQMREGVATLIAE
jgi:hypothetical protein